MLSTKLRGVMVRGEWLEKSVLEQKLDALTKSYVTGAHLSPSDFGVPSKQGRLIFCSRLRLATLN